MRFNAADGVTVEPTDFEPSWLDTAEQAVALLEVAVEQDAAGRLRRGHRRALYLFLLLTGARIDEALSLRWSDLALADGVVRIPDAKTPAGRRTIPLYPPVQEALTELKALRRPTEPGVLVFGNAAGARDNDSNVRNRWLAKDVAEANRRLSAKGRLPIRTRPEGATAGARFTPHSFRRTFASLLFIEGRDPAYVMLVLGHTDAALSLGTYAKMRTVDENVRARWRAFVATGSADLPEKANAASHEDAQAESMRS